MPKQDFRTFLIYKHTSPSGKSYIGQTCDLEVREKAHRKEANCPIFYKAIKKYGWENFEHEILSDGLTLDEANHLEAFYIRSENTLSPFGYNLMTGGGNSRHSEASKAKMSESRKGNTYCLGFKHTKETKAKHSKALIGNQYAAGTKRSQDAIARSSAAAIGSKRSNEAKAKMRAAWLLRSPMTNETKAKIAFAAANISDETRAKQSAARIGVRPTEATRAKLSAARIGKKFTDEHKLNLSKSMTGKKFTDEHRENLSLAAKRRNHA
jgi:group I intron endonuclease